MLAEVLLDFFPIALIIPNALAPRTHRQQAAQLPYLVERLGEFPVQSPLPFEVLPDAGDRYT